MRQGMHDTQLRWNWHFQLPIVHCWRKLGSCWFKVCITTIHRNMSSSSGHLMIKALSQDCPMLEAPSGRSQGVRWTGLVPRWVHTNGSVGACVTYLLLPMYKSCNFNRAVASINTNCSLSRESDAALFLQLYRPRKRQLIWEAWSWEWKVWTAARLFAGSRTSAAHARASPGEAPEMCTPAAFCSVLLELAPLAWQELCCS